MIQTPLKSIAKLASLICLIGLATAAQAQSPLNTRLVESGLLERFTEDGTWRVSITDTEIHYACITCRSEVTAQIRVVPFSSPTDLNLDATQFLTRRRAYCADLATTPDDRCTAASQTSHSRISQTGFSTSQIQGGQIEHAFSFYYSDHQIGPVRIDLSLTFEASAPASPELTQTLLHHASRLTLRF